MKRIYLDIAATDSVTLEDQEYHYLKNVLRYSVGDQFQILTPTELLFGEVAEVKKRSCDVQIISRETLPPTNYSFTVLQCILKREYMDTVIEKYTELGVTKIIPVVSQYSLSELKDNSKHRYMEIAKKAALQSERDRLPIIGEVIRFNEIAPIEGDNIVFYERGEISQPIIRSKSVQIVIGAEGGFSPAEIELLKGRGFSLSTPLRSILKAETAAVLFAGLTRIGISNES
ncbi:MAG: 16S rRNA (uracil(1498)-N(3))-methyltransferase [Deferribacteraceae bacterium]|jgi:16S rRNA (uracil1498-N3)-methyltransferase|nr:16S rRNA (uracil(1498)-N(3))-methyltransferase [Deferribacteraceae bacterium]